MSLAILFHFLCTQHVSDINISIIRSLRLCCWITTSVVLFSVRCMLEIWCGWVLSGARFAVWSLQNEHHELRTTQSQALMMDILISETCWVHKKWNKIASDIALVFYSSTITMMHGPINVRLFGCYLKPNKCEYFTVWAIIQPVCCVPSEMRFVRWFAHLELPWIQNLTLHFPKCDVIQCLLI